MAFVTPAFTGTNEFRVQGISQDNQVGEFHALEIVPNTLIRIEIWA
jgi:hypothetical protein